MGVSLEGLAVVPLETAYERAYEAHWPTVFRFALAWTNDWGAAEDVAQETFTRLWRNRSSVEWDRDVLPWLLVTARHLLTDRFRMLRRRLLRFTPPATLDEATADRWLDVQRAMSRLSALERSALFLVALEGRDSTDAAHLMGTTPGAIRAAVSRARDKLEAHR
ncbi:MAG: sigma-70 family RNA polymerase sigma factor [Chloroflexi bacterium]|nr:sigma-70 family RNA polymerase sigma factor [Chloroflexota bacterium]